MILRLLALGSLLLMTAICSTLCVYGFFHGDYFTFAMNFCTTFYNAQVVARIFR